MSRVNAAASSQEHFSVEEQNSTDTKVQKVAQQNIEPPPEKERPWYKKTWRFVFKPVEDGIRYVKHHPKECLIAVGTAVVVVGGLILASQSGDYPDDRPPGIIDEDLDPFAPYDNPPPPINPQPRPNYPPEQTIIDTPPPLPERSLDKGDQLMEKMERMKQENEEKKAQSEQLVSNDQNSENTPDSHEAFAETPLTEAKLPITDGAIYPVTSLPKATTALGEKLPKESSLDSDEFVSQLVEQSGTFLNSSFDVVTFNPRKLENPTDKNENIIEAVDLDQLMSTTNFTLSIETVLSKVDSTVDRDLQNLPAIKTFHEGPIINPFDTKTSKDIPTKNFPNLFSKVENFNHTPLNIEDFSISKEEKLTRFDKKELDPGTVISSNSTRLTNEPLPKAEVIFVNGIGNTREDAESLREWSETVADVNSIELVYNKKKGDWVATEAAYAMGAKVKQAFQHGTFGLTDTSKKIILKALEFNNRSSSEDDRLIGKVHSRGALDMKIALKFLNEYYPEVAQKIIVVAVAPADFIPQKLCGKVYHLVSTGDFIPELASETYERCKKEGTVIELPRKGSYMNTHTLQGGPYEKELKRIFSEFHKDYEM